MTLAEHIARCDREIEWCRKAARAATSDSDRYGLAWAEMDWLLAKQLYEEELRAAVEDKDGVDIGS